MNEVRENGLRIYNNPQFGAVRTMEIDGEPWFVGKDVSGALGYKDTDKSLRYNVDADDKLTRQISGSGQKRNMILINESGIYSLIFSSKLPTAKEFKKWVTSEVLPSIRKTGTYTVARKLDSYLIENPVERAKRWIEEYEEKALLQSTIEEQKPLVEFAKHINDSEDYIDIGAFAKVITNKHGIKIGRNKLYQWLKDNKYLMFNNIPYQKYIDNKYFKVIETQKLINGNVKVFFKTLISCKAQKKIIEEIKADISKDNTTLSA